MKITWFGHAAFLIETHTPHDTVRIITDPYSSVIGFDPINEPADIVTLSHDNPKYHSHLGDIEGSPLVLAGLEMVDEIRHANDVCFGAVQVYEDEAGNGPNTMMWIENEGLRVLHMGDVGHRIMPDQLAACGPVDILLALAGDGPTINLADLLEFCEQLQPRLVVPMHYGVPKLDLKLKPVEEFATLFAPRPVHFASDITLKVTRQTLPERMTLYVLPHVR